MENKEDKENKTNRGNETNKINKLEIIYGNLFDSKDSLAHCVSLDFKMGAGIALKFRQIFGNIDKLRSMKCKVGEVAYLQDNDRYIFYLITKEKYFQKPTYKSLELSLQNLYNLCKKLDIMKLSIPKIGCGLDKLDWNRVQDIIESVFIDIKITVYLLESEKKVK